MPVNFKDQVLKERLKSHKPMQLIIEVFSEADLSNDAKRYYDLSTSQVLGIKKMDYVIDQLRLRILSEQGGNFSVALNHLLNEIHAICYAVEKPTQDEA